MTVRHHPLIEETSPYQGPAPIGGQTDYFGVYYSPRLASDPEQSYYNANDDNDIKAYSYAETTAQYPGFNEEYFEHIDLMESIRNAGPRYVMFELGANYGRWGLRAYKYAQKMGVTDLEFLFVEGDPLHFSDLIHHLKLNKVPSNIVKCFKGLVSGASGVAPFIVARPGHKHPRKWRGQGMVGHVNNETLKDPRFAPARYFDEVMYYDEQRDEGYIQLPTFTLSALLQPYPCVDLVDMDIQGAEADVIDEAIDELNLRVKRLHIGTHSREIEDRMRKTLSRQGWICLHDFPNLSTSDTPYGRIEFCDGVQSWVNPRLSA